MASITRAVFFAIATVKATCGAAFAAPSNDAFANATALSSALPATLSGDAFGATCETGEPVVDSSSYNGSIWCVWTPVTSGTARPVFTWTADGSGIVNGSTFRLVVHNGTTLDGLTQLAMGTEVTPAGSFNFTAGQTYYFQMMVWTDSSAATFPCTFTLSDAPAVPSNDSFAGASVLGDALPIAAAGTTVAATLESGETADSNQSRSVWYKWTPVAGGSTAFTITPTDAQAQPVLEIFTGTAVSALTRIGRIDSDGTSTLAVTAGTPCYLRALTNDPDAPAGPFTIGITAATSGTTPANDNFANATDLGANLDSPASATTLDATLETNEPTPFFMTASVWFKWTAPASGWFEVSATSSSGTTPALAVWQGPTLTNMRLRAASDAYGSDAVFAATAGEIFYLQAGAQGGYADAFELTVSSAADPGIPRVTHIACSPASVNVSSTNQSVTATLTLAGPADGLIAEVDVLIPGGGLVVSLATADLVQTSGTPGNGTFTAQFSVPKKSPPGIYPIIIYLTNEDGSWAGTCAPTGLITTRNAPATWYDFVDVPAGNNFLTVTNTGTVAGPPAATSFSATASVNTSTAAASIALSAHLTGAVAVTAASVMWQDPAGLIPADATGLDRTAGSGTNGTWTATIPVPAHTVAGRLNLTMIVWDAIGQARSYGYQYGAGGMTDQFEGALQTFPNGASSFVTIINTGAADILPPQVSNLTFSPNPATFGNTGQVDVTVSATVADALSGISSVSVDFPEAPAVDSLVLTPTGGNTYSAVMTFHRADFAPGAVAPEVVTADLLNNYGVFTPVVPGISKLTLLPQPGTYEAWIAGYPIASPDNDPTANPQGDGIVNLAKYAFNIDPDLTISGAARYLTPITGTTGLPNISTTGSGTNLRLRVEYIRRVNSPGTTYTVEFSSNPTSGWLPASAPETTTPIDPQWQRVVVEDSAGSGAPARFGRVNLTFTP